MRWWSVSLGAMLALLILTSGAGHAEELTEELQRAIQRDASDVRGLRPKTEVLFKRVSQDELRTNLLEELNDPETVELLETARKYNILLGTIPPDLDLHQILVDTLSGAILGQYRMVDKTMYLVAESDAPVSPETKIVLAHEYVHALQDQHFDLGTLTEKVKDHDDRSLALRALFEGDATLSEFIFEREKLSSDEQAVIRRQRAEINPGLGPIPFILQEELRFPYVDGVFFVLDLWQRGGYEQIDAIYLDPPVSTEQIIHPEKYLSGEMPVDLGLPDLLPTFGAGWKQTYANVMGELELRILIETFTDTSTAARASEGWGGDAFVVLEGPDDKVAWVMDSAWDTEEDAREFAESFGFSLDRRFGVDRVTVIDEPGRSIWNTPVGVIAAARNQSRVAVVYAPERGQADSTLGLLRPESTAPRLPVATPKPQ